jgi:hypothetical protein
MDRALVEKVWQRAGHRCEYCQVLQIHDPLPFEIDHIIAKKHRGGSQLRNLCLACLACNNHKGPNVADWILRPRKLFRFLIRVATNGMCIFAGKARS